ncbi:succinate-semialdehyde dehydrogenase [Thioalkalivibrio denitrificans]|uniref:Succinate-semialdehyde dehydrogenase n=1 Tax=Thioalkalivibrio denitrificans TaxID=108003 RepID=A0A1V3ND63_9GAMM|nr:NAD-dependent succinate-semialdehyde dehydrogenase [Thioalkalivibrio denitrificans]OOG23039.1 succinate-semialdehyde dehydrogenase [Thioalkalivibrio denitrificans]
MLSVNPANGAQMGRFEPWDDSRIESALAQAGEAAPAWAKLHMAERARFLQGAARVLREREPEFSRLITEEMGKLISEASAEIEKCAKVCDYYAAEAERFLTDEVLASDASRSLVAWQPLGTVLAVMPWNFPFWQVFRFAAPALMAGNTALLKHASNVPRCALAIESVFEAAGFPRGVFRTLMIGASQVEGVIRDRRVHAVTLTGSEPAGRAVAAVAGEVLKKTVLELGGSDPFVVLEDADLELTVEQAVASRYMNAGQSCIAAKRFVVVEPVAETFLEQFREAVRALRPGDPMDESTTLAPMARGDLRDALHAQVHESVKHGAQVLEGGQPVEGKGNWYQASILDGVGPGMPAYEEEMFGPVAAILRARDEDDAVRIANDTRFGLGGSVWSRDAARGEAVARRLACGCAFVNGLVKSDPRLPFGGIKDSGYGRELSLLGIREFVNAKTVWIR